MLRDDTLARGRDLLRLVLAREAPALFARCDERGATHDGAGTTNEDFHAWDQPILAPADGDVVAVVDGVADNVPGQMNPAAPIGNHVVLRVGDGAFGRREPLARRAGARTVRAHTAVNWRSLRRYRTPPCGA